MFKVGDRVKIIFGPYEGKKGNIISISRGIKEDLYLVKFDKPEKTFYNVEKETAICHSHEIQLFESLIDDIINKISSILE